MSFEYVQAWIIREGFEEVHDEILRRWILRAGSVPYLGFIRLVTPPKTLPRKRIMIYWFDCVEDWRQFRVETKIDWLNFVGQWSQYIELDSYRVLFWSKGEYYGK